MQEQILSLVAANKAILANAQVQPLAQPQAQAEDPVLAHLRSELSLSEQKAGQVAAEAVSSQAAEEKHRRELEAVEQAKGAMEDELRKELLASERSFKAQMEAIEAAKTIAAANPNPQRPPMASHGEINAPGHHWRRCRCCMEYQPVHLACSACGREACETWCIDKVDGSCPTCRVDGYPQRASPAGGPHGGPMVPGTNIPEGVQPPPVLSAPMGQTRTTHTATGQQPGQASSSASGGLTAGLGPGGMGDSPGAPEGGGEDPNRRGDGSGRTRDRESSSERKKRKDQERREKKICCCPLGQGGRPARARHCRRRRRPVARDRPPRSPAIRPVRR